MKNLLICHIMENKDHEVGIKKCKTFDQDFKWKKRAFPIARDAIWYDKKKVGHLHIEINEADGTYRHVYNEKNNIIDDKCTACGGQISIDAQAVRSMVNRNTIKSFWGIDNSYVLLLMIMGIVAVILVGAVFYLVGENQKTNQLLQKYLQPVPNTVTSSNPQFILGVLA